MMGRLRIEALARDGDAAFHHDDETTLLVPLTVPPGLPVADLARHLQELGRQWPGADVVEIAVTPGDLLRISRLIVPLGGGWPKVEAAPEARFFEVRFPGLVALLMIGLFIAALVGRRW